MSTSTSVEQRQAGPVTPGTGGFVARYRLRLHRLNSSPYVTEPVRCNEPEAVGLFLHRLMAGYDREVLGVLLVDRNKIAIGHTIAYIGTLDTVVAEPRGLFVPALLANAPAVILFHNHPAGVAQPSFEDLNFTHCMAEAGKLLKVEVLDHIVLGKPPDFASVLYHLGTPELLPKSMTRRGLGLPFRNRRCSFRHDMNSRANQRQLILQPHAPTGSACVLPNQGHRSGDEMGESMSQLDFEIETAQTLDELVSKVQTRLEEGWSPAGGVSNIAGQVCQSLIRTHNPSSLLPKASQRLV